MDETEGARSTCALCGAAGPAEALAEAGWLAPETIERVRAAHPGWARQDGACPACVQEALLQQLLERGENAFHRSVQRLWPLDAEAAFGALPTPLRMHADPRFLGRGITLALVDAAFYPHPDLAQPRNRIRAWVDASREGVECRLFRSDEAPRWPGWDAAQPGQWHGLMTSAVAAGNGHRSHGLYRGMAPEAQLVLVQVQDAGGRIRNEAVARALSWLETQGAALGVRVVSLSLGADPVDPLLGNPIDAAVERLVGRGVVVLAAAGNDGVRRLVPPGTAPQALTIGGLDDRNTFGHAQRELWRSNYGASALGDAKPELVAPSLRVVAPLLPGSPLAGEAALLFARRARGDSGVEARLAEARLVSPHYQHVEGTSFAAPLVAGAVAAMLEARPELRPQRVREALLAAAESVAGAPPERQGAGALDAGRAVAYALADAAAGGGPQLDAQRVRFRLHDPRAREVRLLGSFDAWREPGRPARRLEGGLWEAELPRPRPARYAYKFKIDGARWLADPGNPARVHDGRGGFNSVLEVAGPGSAEPHSEHGQRQGAS